MGHIYDVDRSVAVDVEERDDAGVGQVVKAAAVVELREYALDKRGVGHVEVVVLGHVADDLRVRVDGTDVLERYAVVLGIALCIGALDALDLELGTALKRVFADDADALGNDQLFQIAAVLEHTQAERRVLGADRGDALRKRERLQTAAVRAC